MIGYTKNCCSSSSKCKFMKVNISVTITSFGLYLSTEKQIENRRYKAFINNQFNALIVTYKKNNIKT